MTDVRCISRRACAERPGSGPPRVPGRAHLGDQIRAVMEGGGTDHEAWFEPDHPHVEPGRVEARGLGPPRWER